MAGCVHLNLLSFPIPKVKTIWTFTALVIGERRFVKIKEYICVDS